MSMWIWRDRGGFFGSVFGGEVGAVGGEDGVGLYEVLADAVVVGAGDGGGDLERVEHAGRAAGGDEVAAESGEDHGGGDLDGFAVLDGWEVEGEGRAAGAGEVLGEDGVALTLGIGVERMDDGGQSAGR
jgi:hypothetical protein